MVVAGAVAGGWGGRGGAQSMSERVSQSAVSPLSRVSPLKRRKFEMKGILFTASHF